MAEYMCDSNSEPKYDSSTNPKAKGSVDFGPDAAKRLMDALERKITENMSPEELKQYKKQQEQEERKEYWESLFGPARRRNQIDWNRIYNLEREAR